MTSFSTQYRPRAALRHVQPRLRRAETSPAKLGQTDSISSRIGRPSRVSPLLRQCFTCFSQPPSDMNNSNMGLRVNLVPCSLPHLGLQHFTFAMKSLASSLDIASVPHQHLGPPRSQSLRRIYLDPETIMRRRSPCSPHRLLTR